MCVALPPVGANLFVNAPSGRTASGADFPGNINMPTTCVQVYMSCQDRLLGDGA